MKRIWMPLCLLIGLTVGALAQGPLTPIGQLQGRTDSNGALMVFGSAEALPQTPLTPIANLRGRTDSNGALYVTLTGGTGACALGVTQVAFGDATTAACVGDSGFTYNQTQNAVTLSGALAPTGVGGQLAILYMNGTVTPSANTNAKYGIYNYIEKPAGNAFNITNQFAGTYSEAFVKGTGTIQGIYGGDFEAHSDSAASISTSMVGVYAEAKTSAGFSGTITNHLRGIDVWSESAGTGTASGVIGGLFTAKDSNTTTTLPFVEGLDISATGNAKTTTTYGAVVSASGVTGGQDVFGFYGGGTAVSNLSGVLKAAYLTATVGATSTVTGGIFGLDILAQTQSSNSNQTIGVNITASDTGAASPTMYGLKSNTTGSGTLYGVYVDGDAGLLNEIKGQTRIADALVIGTTGTTFPVDSANVLQVYGSTAPLVGATMTYIDFQPGTDVSRVVPTNQDAFGMFLGPIMTTAASGTHGRIASLSVDPPTLTSGGSTVTEAASLYINNAPSLGTNKFAIHVNAGTSEFDGILSAFHITGNGSTPAVTDTTANSCGTGTQTITGNDNAGKVTVIGSAGTSCTVTFATAFTNAPACSASNETTAALARATSTQTTVILAGSFSQNDVIAYVCVGK